MAEPTDSHPRLPLDSDAPSAVAATTDAAPRRALHLRPAAVTAVAVGGLVGTTARYGLEELFPTAPGAWPVTTFVINVVGALLLGVLLEALTRLGPDTSWRRPARLGAGTGALGSFTTYSTLAVDTDLLLHGGHAVSALSYAVGTVLAGLVATATGIAVGVALGAARDRRSGR
ncbi:CrcB family protein [Rhodococcus sp. DMF-1]|uniref:fluoride efflux transporter FluC n=1 Tax=Rhodococcus sp. DMF-1 TaxID=2907624 RepID=UPI001F3F6024|nr:CrcB family protein [Rhodococcus sp. DMF-1]UIR35118.1 CrcB family protein [Rhodococcus sp. DMF-1]